MIRYRRFTSEDWMLWGGAESLPDGSRPYVGEAFWPDGTGAMVLISGGAEEGEPEKVGLDVVVGVDGDHYWTHKPLPPVEAKRLGALLPERLDPVTLSALGFWRAV